MAPKTTVMIVDDHTMIRETWSLLLNMAGKYEVVLETGEAEKAILAARDKRPDIVLLDVNMTPSGGVELLQAIKKYSPGSKVIGVSIHSQPAYAKKLLKSGAKGYVTRNSPSTELLQAIEEVMEGKNYICTEVKNVLTANMLGPDDEKSIRVDLLTLKEMEIIQYLKKGLISKEIGQQMNISPKTVEVHRHNIFKKLKVKNSVGLMQVINEQAL